ncbi:hypothetical protein FBF83_06550 [Pseudalkalibacillus hwajinpoensis]|uniref:30S ribosomal protein S14 n=1 Tax=Guptibacillus hwajinpoensis TaxID=208199 RepID=A0A4U1MMC8_9BACL|nr:hypothetical protein FBF83_06550 [Pseudalkalibacillus hwajinpoensis]
MAKSETCGIYNKGYLREFRMSRIAFREYAHKGQIPGVKKSSW